MLKWNVNPKRNQIAKFTPFLSYQHLISIMSIDQKVNSNFKILTTFEPMTWWLLLISLLLISLVNMKLTRIFLINYAISLIDHFECLLTKKSKCDFNKIINQLFCLKVGSLSSKRIYKLSYLLWIISSFFLMTIFSNDILSKLISPLYETINSIDQLNQYKSSMTSIIWDKQFFVTNNLVYNLINLMQLDSVLILKYV